jgi:hypothetical protein
MQVLNAHRLAYNRQPAQQRPLQVRKAGVLLVEQLPHTAKDHLALLQEEGDLAIEEVHDGLRNDFEGQGIARVRLDQLRLVSRAYPS